MDRHQRPALFNVMKGMFAYELNGLIHDATSPLKTEMGEIKLELLSSKTEAEAEINKLKKDLGFAQTKIELLKKLIAAHEKELGYDMGMKIEPLKPAFVTGPGDSNRSSETKVNKDK